MSILIRQHIINLLNGFRKFKAEYTFDHFKINADNTLGNMSYINHGVFTINDTTHMAFVWLESAFFKKVGDKWKLEFLHSTQKTP